MKHILKFAKDETVLCISFLLAAASMFITPPNAGYLEYIDYSVIAILFCLMVTIQGFGESGVFELISRKLTSLFANTRALSAALSVLSFFMAMLITNDVALLTFVPLTLTLFKGQDKVLIRCIILETAAANLGSMVTPIGNPQNLFIYSYYNFSLGEFFKIMLPISAISLALILISLVLVPSEKIERTPKQSQGNTVSFKFTGKFFLYAAIFLLSVCTVARLVDYRICLAVTLVAVLAFDRKILAKPDYCLLGTFVCFFIFVGNISAVGAVRDFISCILDGHVLLISCLLSQIISNVPCAIMMSGFTDNASELLLGVNIGGTGTLIASLASLISFKLYSKSAASKKGRYFLEFTLYNFAFLGVLLISAYLIY